MFVRNSEGSVAIYASAMIGVLVILLGVSVDLGRLYLVRNNMEAALDAAALGAVVTSSSKDYKLEFAAMFNANFSRNSHHEKLITSINKNGDKYTASASVEVQTLFLGVMGFKTLPTSVSVEIKKGLNQAINKVEIALAVQGGQLHTTNGNTEGYDIKAGLKKFINDVYSNSQHGTAYMSVIPYTDSVMLAKRTRGPTSSSFLTGVNPSTSNLPFKWLQPTRQFVYKQTLKKFWYIPADPEWGDFEINLSAREPWWMEECQFWGRNYIDEPQKCLWQTFPKIDGLNDTSDVPPTSDSTKFSMPLNYSRVEANFKNITPLLFAATDKQAAIDTIENIRFIADADFSPGGAADQEYWPFGYYNRPLLYAPTQSLGEGPVMFPRPNVGMLWAWFTLSEKWRGVWDVSRTNLPLLEDAESKKVVVFIIGSHYLGTHHTSWVYKKSDGKYYDIEKTETICKEMKKQGIIIYTIILNPFLYTWNTMTPILQECASQPEFFYFPKTEKDFKDSLGKINDSIFQNTTASKPIVTK